MLSSSSDGSRERTNSSGTDQELSPPTSLDNNSIVNSDNNNVIMGSPSPSLTLVESSSTSSQHIFAKPLPVIRSTSSSFTRSNSGGGAGGVGNAAIGGGSPHTQFEMDSLSPSGLYLLSTTGMNQQQQHHPSFGTSTSASSLSSMHHRLTLSNLGGGSGEGASLMKADDASISLKSATGMDSSLQRSLEEEEAPYLDMSMTSNSGSSPRSLIISQSEEVSGDRGQ